MDKDTRIRMPFGAAIACIMITALVIVGVFAGVKLVRNMALDIQAKDDPQTELNTVQPSGDSGNLLPGPTGNSSFPSENLNTTDDPNADASKYAIIDRCMNAAVSIDITMKQGYTSVLAGSGSGVIVTNTGYIITCNHVIEGAESIIVYLNDGSTYTAELIGADPITDVAVIKIEGNSFPYATLGHSSDLRVGESVFAIGNAIGELSNTYTSGSVSGLDRSITIDGKEMTLLQTDAAINHGNSGGGLFRASDGALIGIVNAKSSGSSIEGLGFAIPSDLVSEISSDLMDYGFVTGRPYLGVSTQDVSMNGFSFFGQQNTYPCVVSVVENSPADKAGIQVNDIITAVDGNSVSSGEALSIMINSYNIGDQITLTIKRGNSSVSISVTLEERTSK